MADRRGQVILLIGSRFDFTFEPETFTGKVVRRGAIRGAAPAVWRVCSKCGGSGEARGRGGFMEPCGPCRATGRVKVDDYTGDAVVTADANLSLAELIRRDTKHVKCPDCQDLAGNPTGLIRGEPCRRCRGSEQVAVPGSWLSEPTTVDRLEGDAEAALLNQIGRRDAAGSYRELEEALAGISRHVNKPEPYRTLTIQHARARRLLDEVFLPPTVRDLGDLWEADRGLVELALAYVVSRMPDPIRVPAAVVANQRVLRGRRTAAKRSEGSSPRALVQRDREIVRLAREGRGAQWIAAEYGLSVRSVYEIVKQKESAA
jgi:hypothetical protein